MHFDDIKKDVEDVFENHPKRQVLIEKVKNAQGLFEYWKRQEEKQIRNEGFKLRCNFPAKAFLEKIWIEDLYNLLLAELEELLAQQDLEEERRQKIMLFKENLTGIKQVFVDGIQKMKEPTVTAKMLFPQLTINDDTILFYDQNDLSAIIGALIDKFSERTSNGLIFELQLPPNRNEKLSDEDNIRNYAEIIFNKAAQCGISPDKLTVYVNGRQIDPASMFKDSIERWKKESSNVFEERFNKAIKEESPYFK
jgi:hypothetical protein